MTICPPMEVFQMYEDGWVSNMGSTGQLKEDAPEHMKKIWADWQKDLEEALQFQASMKWL